MAKKVGKSLSFCIKDIILGKVNIEDVSVILAGTNIPDDDVLNKVIEQYRKSYWRENPDLGEEICRKLFDEGKIFQPRLRGEAPLHKGGDWWVHDEEADPRLAGTRQSPPDSPPPPPSCSRE